MRVGMSSVNDLVLVQGMADTKEALRRWNDHPWQMLRPWAALSLAIACGLLGAVWVVAKLTTPDLTRYAIPGYNSDATFNDYLAVLYRNSLVLALHAMACVAGFIAGSSLPIAADGYTGWWGRVHHHAGRIAMAFVAAATVFSLTTQAYALGVTASDLADAHGISPGRLIAGLLLHAVPELCALFLPLAAWFLASRRGAWNELLAATFITTAIAVPVLLCAAAVEVWVSPHVLYFLK
jgi:hypothetical protein